MVELRRTANLQDVGEVFHVARISENAVRVLGEVDVQSASGAGRRLSGLVVGLLQPEGFQVNITAGE